MPITATVPTTIRLPLDLAEALDAEARRTGRTKTDIVVSGLRKELDMSAFDAKEFADSWAAEIVGQMSDDSKADIAAHGAAAWRGGISEMSGWDDVPDDKQDIVLGMVVARIEELCR